MKKNAIAFGQALDRDDFVSTAKLLHPDCRYTIGEDTLVGPEAICGSYEQNMLEGRQKLDHLEWGESWVEEIGEREYYVHFTDYLGHRDLTHVHRCRQKLTFDEAGKIIRIEHIDDPKEQQKLKDFYQKVGL